MEHDHKLYITASAPAADSNNITYSQHALYEVTLAGGKASWKSVLEDNSTAKDLVTGKDTKLNLSDPDSSVNVPAVVPKVGGSLLLDSQGDKQLLFLHDLAPGGTKADLLNLNTQVDDTTFATKSTGTLYVVDSGTGQLLAITGPFTAGQAFVSVPKDFDSLVKTLGSLDLTTGKITAWGTGFGNPKGLLLTDESYVPPAPGSGTPSTSASSSASASPSAGKSASAPASTPASTPTAASANSNSLAHTGADNTLGLGGAAVGLLVVGGGVLVIARR